MSFLTIRDLALENDYLRLEIHHNTGRPHQGIANVIPVSFDYPNRAAELTQVDCDCGIGGLLNHYQVRQVA